jgi:predicted phosphodiesterase
MEGSLTPSRPDVALVYSKPLSINRVCAGPREFLQRECSTAGHPNLEFNIMRALDRRQFVQLAGLGGAVYASGLAGPAQAAGHEDFYFVQLSDTHWGFEGAPNPDAKGTLPKAIAAVNALAQAPDFVIFTGDLTHTTDDPQQRRRRMAEFRDIAAQLSVKTVRFIPGEHDASLDSGKAFKEFFGAPNYTFEHKGVHFIVLDNVSDPGARLGDAQLAWLADDLDKQAKDARIVVFAHRPLFDLYPQWDWATRDGAKAIELLMPYANVTVFYGHIHQEHHQMTGHIAHHSAKSLIFALPVAGSQPKRSPLPWDPAQPHRGLGFRQVEAQKTAYLIKELPVAKA